MPTVGKKTFLNRKKTSAGSRLREGQQPVMTGWGEGRKTGQRHAEKSQR